MNLARFILPIGLVTIPFMVIHSLLDPAQALRYLYLTLFGTGVMIWSRISCARELAETLSKVITWRNPFFICSLVWLLATVLSLSVSLQKSEGLVETARVIFFVLSYLFVSLWVRIKPENIVSIATGFCLISLILSIIGFKDLYQSWQHFTPTDSYYHLSGNMGNRNLLAIMLSLCLPFHFIVFNNYRSKYVRLALAVNFIVAFALVILTSSRSGWLGLAVFLLVLSVGIIAGHFKGFIKQSITRKLALALSACLLIIPFSFLLLYTANHHALENVEQRIKSFYNFNTEKNIHAESIKERIVIWKSSIRLIKEHPIRGVGAGNWKFRYPEKGLPERCQTGETTFLQPHNDYLWVWAETGLIGGLAYISFFVIAIILLIRSLWYGKNYVDHLALLAGIGMFAVHSFFDFPKERPLILFTFSCMLAFINTGKKDNIPVYLKKIFNGIFLSLIVLAFVTTAFWVVRIHGEYHVKKAMEAHEKGKFSEEKHHLDKVFIPFFESDLMGAPLDWYKSKVAYYQGDIESYIQYSESALKLNPYHLYILYNLGTIYYQRGDISKAQGYWERAISIAPKFTDVAMNLSGIYYNNGELIKAVNLLSAPEIDYADETNSKIVITVLGDYVKAISDTVSNQEIKNTLLKLSTNSDRLKKLQKAMAEQEITPFVAVLNAATVDVN